MSLGLVGSGGPLAVVCDRVRDGVFVLERASDTLTFTDVTTPPVPSLFRGFSAPVRIEMDMADADRLVLLRHDSDPFNRWQAAQSVAMRLLVQGTRSGILAKEAAEALAAALAAFLDGEAPWSWRYRARRMSPTRSAPRSTPMPSIAPDTLCGEPSRPASRSASGTCATPWRTRPGPRSAPTQPPRADVRCAMPPSTS